MSAVILDLRARLPVHHAGVAPRAQRLALAWRDYLRSVSDACYEAHVRAQGALTHRMVYERTKRARARWLDILKERSI